MPFGQRLDECEGFIHVAIWSISGSGASGAESTCQCRRLRRSGFHPWVVKLPGEGNGNPLQYFCLENPMGRGAGGLKESDMTEHAHIWGTSILDGDGSGPGAWSRSSGVNKK